VTRLAWILGLSAALAYAALLRVGLGQMGPETGGLQPFDLRILGYGPSEAAEYMAAMTEEGRRLALGPVRMLDTIFPPLFGAFIAALFVLNGRPWLAVLPFGYVAADLWENARIGAMLAAGDPSLAEGASNLTQGKWALLLLALSALWTVWRARRKGEQG
jgi:hypothetical protein